MIKNPCIDCREPKRHPGCHATCDNGIQFSKSLKAAREKVRAEKSVDEMLRLYNAARFQKRVMK